jgi:hypothetical protein
MPLIFISLNSYLWGNHYVSEDLGRSQSYLLNAAVLLDRWQHHF